MKHSLDESVVGLKFNAYEIIELPKAPRKGCVIARCSCGAIKRVQFCHLKNGTVKSCGCSWLGRTVVMHGKSTHPAFRGSYSSWQAMKNRCLNPNNKAFHHYGGRGIGICEEWINDPERFIRDMGARPDGYSLERRDVNKGYCKENCEWIPKGRQLSNTRVNRRIVFRKIIMTATDACRLAGINRVAFWGRLRNRPTQSDQEIFDQMLLDYKPRRQYRRKQSMA